MSFTAELQIVAFNHAAMTAVPKRRFEEKFESNLVDTGAARGSSAAI